MSASPTLPADVRPGGRFASWSPAPPRYVVADVDGTLVGAHPEATEAVLGALARVREAGIAVGVATGRMGPAVEALAARAGLTGPHVLHNGAQVRADGRTIVAWPLSAELAGRLLEVCADHDLYGELYVDDGFWVTDRRPEAAIHWRMLGQEPSGTVADLDLDRHEVVKATVAVFDEPAAPVVVLLTAAGFATGPATSPLAPGLTFLNVTHPDADKGRALRHAAAHLQLPLPAVVAIGDGENDVPMLHVAGTAIAMGQASESVQAAAHLVVPEVDTDGVVHALDACVAWAEAG